MCGIGQPGSMTDANTRAFMGTTTIGVVKAVLKGLAVVAWTTTVVMFTGGAQYPGDPIDFYAFGCLAAMLAMTFTGVVTVMWVVGKESRAAQVNLAREVARALADELEERQLVVQTVEGHDELAGRRA